MCMRAAVGACLQAARVACCPPHHHHHTHTDPAPLPPALPPGAVSCPTCMGAKPLTVDLAAGAASPGGKAAAPAAPTYRNSSILSRWAGGRGGCVQGVFGCSRRLGAQFLRAPSLRRALPPLLLPQD